MWTTAISSLEIIGWALRSAGTPCVAQRDVVPFLIAGLKALEYRGYDSAGISVHAPESTIRRLRTKGKVRDLALDMVGVLAALLVYAGYAWHTRERDA